MERGGTMKKIIFESELKVLEILWNKGDVAAKDIATHLNESTAWSRTTSYTMIRKCVKKGLIERLESDYICRAVITREEAQKQELENLRNKMFDGSSDLLIASLLGESKRTASQVDRLRKMVETVIAEDV